MTNNFNIIAGYRLFRIRKAKKVTLEYISKKAMISTRSISLFENGKKDIDAVDLYKICKCLGVSIGLIYEISENEFKKIISKSSVNNIK